MPKVSKRKFRPFIGLVMSLAGFFPLCNLTMGADEPKPLGIVQQASGLWTSSSSNKRLIRGEFVAANESVITPFTSKGSIAILLFETGDIWRKTCTAATPCEGAFRLPVSQNPEKAGFFSFLSAKSEEPPPIFAGSRSVTRGGPLHTLLVVNHQQVNLKPALEKLQEGRYSLEFAKQSDNSATEPLKLSAEWKPGANLLITAPMPGLYSLRVIAEDGESVGLPAALLVVPPNATKQQATWKEAKDRTAQWRDADQGTVDNVLLATLIALQDQGGH